jgi:UDPglucose 6-dehydrogenase
MQPDRVVIGTDNVRTAEIMKELYGPFMRKQNRMIIMDIRSAEMTKYAANAMLATRISFMNQIANLCERMGADVAAVREGIGSDSRIGYDFLFPGPGYGGSCFPKDVKALIRTAEECNYDFLLLKAVEEVNERQKEVLADKLIKTLGLCRRRTTSYRRLLPAGVSPSNPAPMTCARPPPSPSLNACWLPVPRSVPMTPKPCTRPRKYFGDRIEYSSNQYEILHNADALTIITDWHEYRNPDFRPDQSSTETTADR